MLARLDAGQQRSASQAVALADLTRDAIARVAPQAHDHGIDIVLINALPDIVEVDQAPVHLVLRKFSRMRSSFRRQGAKSW